MKNKKSPLRQKLLVGILIVFVLFIGLFFYAKTFAKVVEFEYPIKFPLNASAPTGDDLEEGVMYYNTTDKKTWIYNGSAWLDNTVVDGNGNITISGTLSAGTIDGSLAGDVSISAANVSSGSFGSGTGGGKATTATTANDLSCSNCIGATEIADGLGTSEIADIFVLNTSDSMSGDLTVSGTVSAGTISGTFSGTVSASNVTSGQFNIGDFYFPNSVGIGTTSPATALDVKGTITATDFSGDLSGNASTATALYANGANCSSGWAPLGVNASGAAESCFDVATQTELNSHANATLVHGATSANTASRIVIRDANGDFSAGTITATDFSGDLSGNATTATTATNFSGSLADSQHHIRFRSG